MNLIIKSGLAVLAASLFTTGASAEGFKITGSLKGLPDSCRVSIINTEKGERGESIANTFAEGDNFTLTGEIANPSFCNLSFSRKNKKGDFFRMMSLPLMLDNSEVTVASAFTWEELKKVSQPSYLVDINGGEAQKQYKEYVAACGKADSIQEAKSYLSARKWLESNNNPDTMAIYNKIKADAYKDFAKVRDEFIKAHPSYYISAVLTKNEMMKNYQYTGDELKAMRKMMKAVPDTARQSQFDRVLAWALNYCKAMPCPEFAVTSDAGKISKISELKDKDKYTFIDIWASWCGPCRAAIPHVKELQQKYGDRLQIFSISADEDEAAWRKAMEEEKMTWAQFHFDYETQLEPAAKALNISAIPRLILLNPAGEIICSTNLPKEVTAVIETHLGK